jgi:hypothetical protein
MRARHTLNGPLIQSGFGDCEPDDDGEAYFAAEVDSEIDAMCRSATVVDHALRELHAENADAFFAGLALLIANPTHADRLHALVDRIEAHIDATRRERAERIVTRRWERAVLDTHADRYADRHADGI